MAEQPAEQAAVAEAVQEVPEHEAPVGADVQPESEEFSFYSALKSLDPLERARRERAEDAREKEERAEGRKRNGPTFVGGGRLGSAVDVQAAAKTAGNGGTRHAIVVNSDKPREAQLRALAAAETRRLGSSGRLCDKLQAKVLKEQLLANKSVGRAFGKALRDTGITTQDANQQDVLAAVSICKQEPVMNPMPATHAGSTVQNLCHTGAQKPSLHQHTHQRTHIPRGLLQAAERRRLQSRRPCLTRVTPTAPMRTSQQTGGQENVMPAPDRQIARMSAESAANESVISTFSVDEQLSRPLAAPVPDAAHPVPKVSRALAHREGLLTDIDGYASMHHGAGQRGNNQGTHDVQGMRWTASRDISADCAPARQDLKEGDYVGTPAGT